jgi:hypothetical protein
MYVEETSIYKQSYKIQKNVNMEWKVARGRPQPPKDKDYRGWYRRHMCCFVTSRISGWQAVLSEDCWEGRTWVEMAEPGCKGDYENEIPGQGGKATPTSQKHMRLLCHEKMGFK